MSAVASAADIRLSCRPGKDGRRLVVPYTVANEGSADVYVMDALPRLDPKSGEIVVGGPWLVVLLGPAGEPVIGKFIPPSPTDRTMAVPVIPLARHLPPGGAVEGCVDIPLPLAETSPYFADLPLRQYEVVEVKAVMFSVGYWIAAQDGLAASPIESAPGLFSIVTRNTIRSARTAAQRFPTRPLELFVRTDAFPRAPIG